MKADSLPFFALAAALALARPPLAANAAPANPNSHFANIDQLIHQPVVSNTAPKAPSVVPKAASPQKPAPPQTAAAPAAAVPTPAAPIVVADTNATGPAPISLTGYVPDDKYKLRVGDKISLQILEDRDAPKGLLVADSGELDAPYVGRVAAADKTCRELAQELKSQLEKEYYYRATVIIAVDVFNKILGRIYVWGQVKQQGPVELLVNEDLTVGKAVLRAGGFGDFADEKHVQVIRPGGTNGAPAQSFTLNMVEILKKGKTDKDMVLQPGDSINVPSRIWNF